MKNTLQYNRSGYAATRASRHVRGFTLIELMIVVVVMAILAALAVPAYQRYAYRARRGDGLDSLYTVAASLERYYTTHNAYTSDLSIVLGSSTLSAQRYYLLKITTQPDASSLADQGFIITAEPQNAQTGDACGTLSFDNFGRHGFSGAATNGSCS